MPHPGPRGDVLVWAQRKQPAVPCPALAWAHGPMGPRDLCQRQAVAMSLCHAPPGETRAGKTNNPSRPERLLQVQRGQGRELGCHIAVSCLFELVHWLCAAMGPPGEMLAVIIVDPSWAVYDPVSTRFVDAHMATMLGM